MGLGCEMWEVKANFLAVRGLVIGERAHQEIKKN